MSYCSLCSKLFPSALEAILKDIMKKTSKTELIWSTQSDQSKYKIELEWTIIKDSKPTVANDMINKTFLIPVPDDIKKLIKREVGVEADGVDSPSAIKKEPISPVRTVISSTSAPSTKTETTTTRALNSDAAQVTTSITTDISKTTITDIPPPTATDIPQNTATDIPQNTATDIPQNTATDVQQTTDILQTTDIPQKTATDVQQTTDILHTFSAKLTTPTATSAVSNDNVTSSEGNVDNSRSPAAKRARTNSNVNTDNWNRDAGAYRYADITFKLVLYCLADGAVAVYGDTLGGDDYDNPDKNGAYFVSPSWQDTEQCWIISSVNKPTFAYFDRWANDQSTKILCICDDDIHLYPCISSFVKWCGYFNNVRQGYWNARNCFRLSVQ